MKKLTNQYNIDGLNLLEMICATSGENPNDFVDKDWTTIADAIGDKLDEMDNQNISYFKILAKIFSPTNDSSLYDFAYYFLSRFAFYTPVYTYNRFCRELYRLISVGSSSLNFEAMILLEAAFEKAGLPYLFFNPYLSTAPADPGKLADLLFNTDNVDETESNKNKETGNSTNTGTNWTRSRPINYKTTDETTADSVDGNNNQNNYTTDGNGERTRTLNRNTTREAILSVINELQTNAKDIWDRLLDKCQILFVNCYSC